MRLVRRVVNGRLCVPIEEDPKGPFMVSPFVRPVNGCGEAMSAERRSRVEVYVGVRLRLALTVLKMRSRKGSRASSGLGFGVYRSKSDRTSQVLVEWGFLARRDRIVGPRRHYLSESGQSGLRAMLRGCRVTKSASPSARGFGKHVPQGVPLRCPPARRV